MARDDFPENVKRALAARVGHLCSNPDCMAPTSGPTRKDADGSINIGVAAHITAASPGGPRYNEAITSLQRASLSNGIWLCQNCAARIDKDPNHYTTKLLYRWKDGAEKRACEMLGIPGKTSRATLGEDTLFVSELLTVPPFAVAFHQITAPECYFNISHQDIPVSWDSTWVDAVRTRTTVVNKSPDCEIVIDGLSIEYDAFTEQFSSAAQYIAQGASYAIEFVHELGSPMQRIARITRSPSSIEALDDEFFANGGRITVSPKSSEAITCSFVALEGQYAFRPYLNAIVGGVRKSIPVFENHCLKVTASSNIPDSGKQWSIHLDGRTRGLGFTQDNLARFGNCVGSKC